MDIGTISTKAKTYIVKCGYYNNLIIVDFDFSSTDLTVEKQNNMWHYPLDLKGQQNIAENFKYCGFANSCITLRDGRLYTCASAAHIKFFNDYFKTGLSVTEDDSIDIYKAKNAEEILNFLAAPIPFCRYCNVRGRTKGHKWNISRKDLAEWT
ncbi:hypothetical protein AGMMS50230_16620 [Spirochaetia bacterium]|nr:hypothetical protein AGMMS50230_16620 [Spirochaetia bacterium]